MDLDTLGFTLSVWMPLAHLAAKIGLLMAAAGALESVGRLLRAYARRIDRS